MADRPEFNDCETDEEDTWSNKRCVEISMEDAFPIRVKDITVQKGIINRFLNFYLTGKTQKGLSACDVIFAVISIIPLSLDSEDFIWRDDNYSDEGSLFYLTPEDKLKKEINNILNKQINVDDSKNNNMVNGDKLHVPNMLETQTIGHDGSGVSSPTDDDARNDLTPTNNAVSNSDFQQNENEANQKTVKHQNFLENMKSSSLNNNLLWYNKKIVVQRETKEIQVYGPVENTAFCFSCNKLLDNWDKDINSRLHLKYFFGFVALTLMRTISKSQQNIIKVFSNKFAKTVYFCLDKISYSIPNPQCIKKSHKNLRKRERSTKIMFAKIVINTYILDSILRKSNKKLNTGGIFNIFKTTVMTHTADYGLGIIKMLQAIASRENDFDLVFQALYSDETAVSWKRVNNFLRIYMSKSSNHVTFHWARIIDSKHLTHLTCEKNFALAVVIAVFIEKLNDNKDIWKANWAKSGENKESYIELGLKMYETYKTKLETELKDQSIEFLSFCNTVTSLCVNSKNESFKHKGNIRTVVDSEDYLKDVETFEDYQDDIDIIKDHHEDNNFIEDDIEIEDYHDDIEIEDYHDIED